MDDFGCCQVWNFSEECICTLCPDQCGVYGIFRPNCWIYIGKGDIRAELLRYARGANPEILAECPTSFCAIVTPYFDWLEKVLILKYCPIVNKRIG